MYVAGFAKMCQIWPFVENVLFGIYILIVDNIIFHSRA